MDEFADKNVVYFGKVKTTGDGRIHVKIGSAGHIDEVASRIKILNVFKCDDHEDFEAFLRGHKDVARHKVKYSRGVFSMTEEDLERAPSRKPLKVPLLTEFITVISFATKNKLCFLDEFLEM